MIASLLPADNQQARADFYFLAKDKRGLYKITVRQTETWYQIFGGQGLREAVWGYSMLKVYPLACPVTQLPCLPVILLTTLLLVFAQLPSQQLQTDFHGLTKPAIPAAWFCLLFAVVSTQHMCHEPAVGAHVPAHIAHNFFS